MDNPWSMFNKILIANRGEIACRIIRTAHRLGIHCVAVYSEIDANALHVQLADEAFCIGPAPSAESYLCVEAIIKAALASGAEAIHPGYGFLSENAEFAEACAKAGICFIGPPPAAMRAMGSKSAAKRIMEKAKIPLVPGYHGAAQDLNTLQAAVKKINYPVLLKAAAGGGGKGMRIVRQADELANALAAAQREALASFGDATVLLEKYLTKPRHVEIQVFADKHDNFVYLFERDCSIQRRHQKIIEEAPAPKMTEKLREKMGKAAVNAARAIGYVGAGTVEFLLDEDGTFYFMEMNTRLQVEHPVTEMITGQDFVEWQFKVAIGEPLPLQQKELKIKGHAFEVRLYAEDPQNDFLPSVGTIQYLKTPVENTHVRLDSGIVQGDYVSHYYDPMLAKLIVWDQDRETALRQLQMALAQCQIVGIHSNLDLLAAIAAHPAFAAAEIDTGFIARHENELFRLPEVTPEILALASLYLLHTQSQKNIGENEDIYSPWNATDNWRLNLQGAQKFNFYANDADIAVVIQHEVDHFILKTVEKNIVVKDFSANEMEVAATIDEQHLQAHIVAVDKKLFLLAAGQRYQITVIDAGQVDHNFHQAEVRAHLTAPMPSKVVAVLVKAGEQVKRGAGLIVVEAMKMEHTIHAPADGIVKEWYFQVGDLVEEGAELLAFEEKN